MQRRSIANLSLCCEDLFRVFGVFRVVFRVASLIECAGVRIAPLFDCGPTQLLFRHLPIGALEVTQHLCFPLLYLVPYRVSTSQRLAFLLILGNYLHSVRTIATSKRADAVSGTCHWSAVFAVSIRICPTLDWGTGGWKDRDSASGN